MGWYTGSDIDLTHLDANSDNAGSARAAIHLMAQAINAMKAGPGSANGVASLNGSSQVPESQLALACLLSANLAGLANVATARTNLGATATGAALFTAADVAAVKTLLGFMSAAGGVFTGAPQWAASPTSDNDLARKKYVDDQVATKQTAIKTAVLAHWNGVGQQGGTFASGAWQVRTLNSEIYDPSSIVTLDAPNNRFTLGAGTYEIEVMAPAFEVNSHRARLYNVTDAAVAAYSQNARSASNSQTVARILTHLVLTGTKVFQVEHRCASTRDTFGFGYPDNFGDAEIYTQVHIKKTA